jgi:hypothetical protein
MKFFVRLVLGACLGVVSTAAVLADEPAQKAATPADKPAEKAAAPGVRRALIVCGLAGDEDHRKLFSETAELMLTGLTKHHGFAAENIKVLWGDEPQEKDGPAVAGSQVATRESIIETGKELVEASQPEDALWVIVLGHAHYDNKLSWINVKGPDLSHIEFSKLFVGLPCREQVFFITTQVSGFFARSLSAPLRVVITATEADQEVNETLFPHKLAKNLAEPPELEEFDVNEDGQATLFDLYLLTAKQTLEDYAANEFLATEHALIEDNGDGRGTEVQLDYFVEDLGGRRRAGKGVPAKPTGDGERANRLVLVLPPPAEKPVEDAKPKAEANPAVEE